MGGVIFMRHATAEDLHIMALVEKLRRRIAAVGRWHSKRRKADSTRIWKKLYRDLEELVREERYPFTSTAFITLTVFPNADKYMLQVHRHNRSLFHGIVGKREKDYQKVIRELNSVLSHYDLILVETPESAKKATTRSLNSQKEYDVKFVQNN